jgi:hypothetical protein
VRGDLEQGRNAWLKVLERGAKRASLKTRRRAKHFAAPVLETQLGDALRANDRQSASPPKLPPDRPHQKPDLPHDGDRLPRQPMLRLGFHQAILDRPIPGRDGGVDARGVGFEHRARFRAQGGEIALRRARNVDLSRQDVAHARGLAHPLCVTASPAAEQRFHLPQTITRRGEAKRNKGVGPRFRLDVRDAPLIPPNVGHDGGLGRRGCAYAHSEQPLSEKIAGGDPGGTKRRESFDSKRARAYIIY